MDNATELHGRFIFHGKILCGRRQSTPGLPGGIYTANENYRIKSNFLKILDNVPYNKSNRLKDVARELKIKILYLPVYSPNLNPIERLWKYMKKEVMANRYFPDLETFQKELMLFLRGIRKHRRELSSLITDNFHIVKT